MSRQESGRTQRMLDAVREHPARFALPTLASAARPYLAWQGEQAAKRGDWREARSRFRQSSGTDYIDGVTARSLHATSNFGAALDPIADGAERILMGKALAPHMSKIAVAVSGVAELDAFRINLQIQDKNNPRVPVAAKWGSALEAAGADVFMTGMIDNDRTLKIAGQAAIVGGAVIRNASYRILRKIIKG